jgi:hypothetical protein
MIAIIVMIMLFLGFFIIVSYNMMSVNHNLSVSSQMDTIDNELNIIKTKLIQSAKPIISSNDYALPYGEDFSASNEHRLPSNFGISLKNIKGHYYQYCPYGIDDGTATTEVVTQNDGSSYGVLNSIIDGVKYTTHSNGFTLKSGAPDIQAFIISKFEDSNVKCSDILYDHDSSTYYLTTAKVAYITKEDVANYYSLQDLSGVIEEFNVDSSNINDIFSVIENDTSNKSYEISLNANVSLASQFNIERDKTKKTDFTIDLNGHELQGDNLILKNVNAFIKGDSTTRTSTSGTLSGVSLVDSEISIENASIGGLVADNSNIVIENSTFNANGNESNTNKSFDISNSTVLFRGNNFLKSNIVGNENALLNLYNSKVDIANGSIVELNRSGSAFKYMIDLNNSNLSIKGTITEKNTSKSQPKDKVVRVGSGSKLYLNGGSLNLLAKNTSGYDYIMVQGELITEGSSNIINAKSQQSLHDFIVVQGGGLSLQNVKIGSNGIVGNGSTIKDEGISSNVNGAKFIFGDASADVYRSSTGCFEGNIFKNEDGTNNSSNSKSDKDNNMSDLDCI